MFNYHLMATEHIPSDLKQRVEELNKVGFIVSLGVLVSDSDQSVGLVYKIAKKKPKT